MSDLSLAELKALLAEAEGSANKEYLEAGQAFFETCVANGSVEQSKSGLSHGFSVSVKNITVDGKQYTFSGYMTDVEQTTLSREVDKAAKQAEKDKAKILVEAARLRDMLVKAGHPVPEDIKVVLAGQESVSA